MANKFYIEDDAKDKILGYARQTYKLLKTEVGGMAVIIKEDDKWIIKDPAIMKQEATSTICHLDQEELAQWYSQMGEKYKEHLVKNELLFLWWHSHHNMDASMSGTDWGTIRETEASVSLVVNNKGEYELIYRGGDPIVETECKLVTINEHESSMSLKEEIEAKVTKEQATITNLQQTRYSGYTPARQVYTNEHQTTMFNSTFELQQPVSEGQDLDDEIEQILLDDADAQLEREELNIDTMLDEKKSHADIAAHLIALNAKHGEERYKIPSKQDYEDGKIQTVDQVISV